MCRGGGGGGGGISGNQFPTFDADSKFAKIPKFPCAGGGGGGFVETNFQLLMLSPNLLKSQISICMWRGGVRGSQFPTFDGESKFAKIPNSHVQVGGGGVGRNQFPNVKFKFSMFQS